MNNRPQASVIRFLSASLVLLLGAFVAGANAAPPEPPTFAADACGYVRGATGCTANDTGIVNIVMDPAFSGSDPTSCTAGTDVTLHLLVTVGTTATERYNIGVLFAKDGKDPTKDPLTTGAQTCYAYAMPIPPFLNLDNPANVCGDLTSAASPKQFQTGAITVPCIAGAGGNLVIPGVAMWDNQPGSCSGVTDLMAGTSSKCKVAVAQTVPVTVVTPTGWGQLVMDIVPHSHPGMFNVRGTPSGGRAATATDVGDGGSVTKSNITADTVVTLAETAGTGTSLANYTSSLACVNSATGASVPVTSNQITMPTPPIGIVCTYTNTRKSATLQLKKQWSNAKVGDSASLTATGIVNGAAASFDSTAGSANELDAGTSVTVYAGEVATLGETVNPAANYTSTGPVCTGTSGLSGSTLTVGAADTTIVCTYTNTRKSTTLQLKKQWANANVGDTAALTATGITNSAGAALNSTAGSANELDAGSAVTVFAGEVATLGETVNPAANYTSAGPVCTNTGGLSGSTLTVGAADGPIVCTYTNTRKQGTLQVRKTWVNAQVGDSASISVTGIVNAATAGLNSTANSANETDPGSVVAMYAGEMATFSESVTPSANYTSSFECVASAGAAAGVAFAKAVGDTYTMPSTPVDVVCTYTNTRKSTTLQLKKQWSNANVGDTASLTATGIINSAGAALSSTADAAGDLDSGTAVTVFAGEVATLGETVNPAANYTSTGPVCTGTTGLSGSTLTVKPGEGPIVCTYTNTRKSATLQLRKQWSNAKVGDTASLTATGITNSATAALSSTADTANDLDSGTAVAVFAGEVATLGETVNPAANYTSTGPVCTGTSGLSGSTLTVGAADTTIVCTYTNTRKSATLQLKKQWSNAKVGDTASLTATGITNSATAALSSTADTANDLDSGTAVAVFAGEVATLGETVNPAANYTSTGPVCTGTSGLSGSTLTVGADDTAIVCTYTNTRKSATLQLKKQWTNAKVGDTAALTATGITNSAGAALNSTADAASDLDSGSAVTVFVGEVATLGETVNPAENYTSTGPVCTGTSGLSGSTLTVGADDTAIVCTYTNTRKSATLQLQKTWINARLGDAVTVSAAGITNSASAALNAVANTANETDPGSVVTVYAGEAATLSEGAITGSGGTYLKDFSCTGNTNALAGSVLTVSASDTAIVCTFTNEWLPPAPPPPQQALAIPVTSPGGLALMAALLALLGAAATRRRGRH